MSRFVYVIYIRTSPEKLWDALTQPEFNKLYWFGAYQDSAWAKGASWKIVLADGKVPDDGEILKIDKPRRMVIRWRHHMMPEAEAEGDARCTITLEPIEDTVKLTVLHEIDVPDSKLINAVSGGWPKILSGLKSLLETGTSLPAALKAVPKS